ncbi:uncharacterized protein LOC111699258 [Eurytemora carolleeae]|uniref:uncharacterized protein LOC111699258 n=1 Tax=Eurytemora carolleeae TaxID=1294199 RepID=UPI000C776374|nr:uncharacterized protein LOC111699258 [Eurytemora carolleeae]|eukprot:XP_023325642.1 uncharacterized protein LOC111699258 [Eurytemora affinis]
MLYMWDWGPNAGMNWMVSLDYLNNKRFIESLSVETHLDNNICIEDVHKVGPFRVWNTADRAWQTDWNLRVECYNETLDCCDKVGVRSTQTTLFVQPDILGEYSFFTGYNGRSVYKHSTQDYQLFFKDWGSNQGENWVIGKNYTDDEILLSSPNMEYVQNDCVTDADEIGLIKPFLVKSNEKYQGWLQDRSLRIECVKFFDPNNPDLREFLKNRRTEENRNRVVYNL